MFEVEARWLGVGKVTGTVSLRRILQLERGPNSLGGGEI
jgi:hypothetical protein